MTQNKTALQEAINIQECMLNASGIGEHEAADIAVEEYFAKYDRTPFETIIDAAQAYTDLPEKIEGMKMSEPCWQQFPDRANTVGGYNNALRDILNLLRESQ